MSGGILDSTRYYSDPCPIGIDHSRQPGKTWIYGLYSTNGCCLYVGQAIDIRKRYTSHKTNFSRNHPELCPIIILPLELVPSEMAMKRERHYQFTFEKIGQAQLSKDFWRTKNGKLKKANSLLWKAAHYR